MADDHRVARYRKLYTRLLRLYPRPYRERFGEGMEQTFGDLCRERARAGKGLLGFVLWMFVETSAGIIREHMRFIIMQKSIIRIAIVVGLILLVPLWGNHYIDGWNWDLFDFVWAGTLLFGTGLTYELVARKGGTIAYRAAVGVACATGLLLVWINAAVGIIGDGDLDGPNAMYFGVLAVGFVGAFFARFGARGMALALFATAVAQMLVPVIALVIWKAGGQDLLIDPNSPHPPFHPGIAPVFGLNAVFAALWLTSAWLFRKGAPKQLPAVAGLVG
jgi:hypothetical protein